MLLPHLSIEKINNLVHCDNLNLIKEKIDEGKGLILLTAHFGNWEFIISSIAANLKGQFNVLIKPQRNPYVTEWLEKTRNVANTKVIPVGVSVNSVRALLQGEIVLIAGDQRGHKDAVRFNFFGNPTAFYTGAAFFTDRTKCNLLMCIIERQPDFNYILHVQEMDFSNLPANYDERIYEITKRYLNYLEYHVANSPEQYFWMHKLWKY